MSFSDIPFQSHWLKLQPNANTTRCASSRALAAMSQYQHKDKFTSVPYDPTFPVITIGKGGHFLSMTDPTDTNVTINASRNTLNLLFTVSETGKSARDKGVEKENQFLQMLSQPNDFPGRHQLQDLCGEWTTDDISDTAAERIKCQLQFDDGVHLPRRPVRDVQINEHNISFKYGKEVRLISTGLIKAAGFVQRTKSTEEETLKRCRLLESVGIPSAEYNERYGYDNIEVDQPLQVANLISESFGQCIYVHQIKPELFIVRDYVIDSPPIAVTSEGVMSNFSDKNVEIKYNVNIDGLPALATFMFRIDSSSYTRPNILQIKVKYVG